MSSLKGINTISVHAGEDDIDIDVTPPIHLSSTFRILGDGQKHIYSRISNPTRDVLEAKLAALEGGRYALAFSSGMAAISTILLSILRPGDKAVFTSDLYGGTKQLLNNILPRFGFKPIYVDTRDLEKVSEVIDGAKILYLETPTNPLMWISDIRELSKMIHEQDGYLIVDNTFASPYIQRPLTLGADVSIHSATKYLSGHSDIIAGAAVFMDDDLYREALTFRSRLGTHLPPFDSYLLIRSIKTLGVRMERHCRNAYELARWLDDHEKVGDVLYPFLDSFPQYGLARRQMSCGGGMISFYLYRDEQEAVDRFLNNLEIITKGVSLGGVESLIQQPYTMTHSSIPEEEKVGIGITRGLIRFSVGIEDVEDLMRDLDNALSKI